MDKWLKRCPYQSCIGRCTHNTSVITKCSDNMDSCCKCDDTCLKFNDCCFDYGFYCTGNFKKTEDKFNQKLNFWEYLKLLSGESDMRSAEKEYTICQPLTIPISNYDTFNFNLISFCPKHMNNSNTLVKDCEINSLRTSLLHHTAILVPVHGLYKKYYCALCHNVSGQNIILAHVDMFCNYETKHMDSIFKRLQKNINEVTVFDLRNKCRITSSFGNISLERYICGEKFSCKPATDDMFEDTCRKFLLPVKLVNGVTKSEHFHNPVCALCKGMPPSQLQCVQLSTIQ